MTGDWLAAFESLTPVTVIVPEYFSAKTASIVVCTESLATVRRSAIATSVVEPSAMDLLAEADITKPPARLALVETSAKVPL